MMVDTKGTMRLLAQKKKGRMSLEGIRFSLKDGVPIELSTRITQEMDAHKNKGASAVAGTPAPNNDNRAKLGYLMQQVGSKQTSSAACTLQDDVVLLEGHLAWPGVRTPNAKQPLATLPKGYWPRRRETFFTRGGSDLEERRRVDVDRYGRIFCPEGSQDCRVELSGIMFVAAEGDPPKPPDPDWDELRLQYHTSSEASVLSTSFDGHELLEAFVRRSNHNEWQMLMFDLRRHAFMELMMPLGPQVHLRVGSERIPSTLASLRTARTIRTRPTRASGTGMRTN
jgi:hypothetical protein